MSDSSSPEFSARQGISLNELSRAYAEAMGSGADTGNSLAPKPHETPCCPEEYSSDAALPLDGSHQGEKDADENGVPVSPLTVIETLLFVGSLDDQPLETSRAADLMRGVTPGDVPQLIEQLNARYQANGCPYKIVADGAGYRMTLRKAFHPVRNKFYGKVREARLSQAAVDTLAIVAYRQPLTAEQVTGLRGTPSGHLLTQLVRRQLLEVERTEGTRQVLYRTSKRFLDLFGLECLEDLPDSE